MALSGCEVCGGSTEHRRKGVKYCSIVCKNRATSRKRNWSTNEAQKAQRRNARLLRVYGLTADEWDALFSSQGNHCALCPRTEPHGTGWHTDHDHVTGQVRGILCHSCNLMLGNAEDNIDTLLNAVTYLMRQSVTNN